jgi:hypothetical protein
VVVETYGAVAVTLGLVVARPRIAKGRWSAATSGPVSSRWARGPAGRPELSTCHAHAPAEQRARKETYRA